MSGLGQDLKLALRVFWKNPAFAAIVILTLALGSGARCPSSGPSGWSCSPLPGRSRGGPAARATP